MHGAKPNRTSRRTRERETRLDGTVYTKKSKKQRYEDTLKKKGKNKKHTPATKPLPDEVKERLKKTNDT